MKMHIIFLTFKIHNPPTNHIESHVESKLLFVFSSFPQYVRWVLSFPSRLTVNVMPETPPSTIFPTQHVNHVDPRLRWCAWNWEKPDVRSQGSHDILTDQNFHSVSENSNSISLAHTSLSISSHWLIISKKVAEYLNKNSLLSD